MRHRERYDSSSDGGGIRFPRLNIRIGKYGRVLFILLLIVLLFVFWPFGSKKSFKTVTCIKDDGHVILLEEVNGVEGIIEDPECPKCREMREQEFSRLLKEALDTLTFKIVDE